MNITLSDYHATALDKFLSRLRPGDYRDMTDNGNDAFHAQQAVEALREAIAEATCGTSVVD